jgi:hypothetical protein
MWDRDLVLNQQAQAAEGRPTTAQVLAKGSTRVATVTAAAPPMTRSGAVYRSQADKSNGTWSWMKDFLFGPSTQTRRG